MFVAPRAGAVPFLPLAIALIGNLPKAGDRAKEAYRSSMRNPAVVALLQGRSVREVAVMEDEVTELLNVTIGGYRAPAPRPRRLRRAICLVIGYFLPVCPVSVDL
jgi:hypothetical protein